MSFPYFFGTVRAKQRGLVAAVGSTLGLCVLVASPPFLSGCGSGGGGNPGDGSTGTTVVRSAVRVLPTDGSVQIANVTDTSVTLSGAGVPALTPGAILVSGQDTGLLRKVVSATAANGQTVVQTEQTTLEDVFQQADIKISGRQFGLADFKNVQLAPGVTVSEGTRSAAQPSRAVIKTLTFTLPPQNLAEGDGRATAEGSVTITLSLDAQIQIDNYGVKHLLFTPTVVGDVALIGKGAYKTAFSKSITYARLDGTPFTIQAGPVPLVFTPHFTLTLNASGSVDVGLILTSRAHVSAAAGAEYTRGTGWKTNLDWSKDGSFTAGRNLYATIDGSLTPAHVEIGLDLYGAASASLKADYPTVGFHLAHDSVAPAGLRFRETATYHCYAGYDVTILGKTLTSYDSGDFLNGTDQWADQFFPDNGGINLGVE